MPPAVWAAFLLQHRKGWRVRVRALRATMNLPGETEAGSAGMQPCRGIIWRTHRADVWQRGRLFSRAAL